MMPVLYSYRRCPYAMRARMALKLANIEVEVREISLRDKPFARAWRMGNGDNYRVWEALT